MAPAALAACLASALGALALPWAPRALLIAALPVVLVGVAIYFAFAPHLGEAQRRARISPALFVWTLAPAVGFYDGVFGPGAGSFLHDRLRPAARLRPDPAMAGARFANFGSNAGSLAVYALSGHIFVPAGLAAGFGTFLGARLGAHMAMRAGARLVRPLIVLVSCAMAAKLMTAPGGLLEPVWKFATGG